MIEKRVPVGDEQLTVSTAAVPLVNGIKEVQSMFNDATGDTFDLTWNGQTETGIAYNANAAAITSALEGLSNAPEVTVTGAGTSGDPWLVTFDSPLGNVAEMTADDTNLTGGTSTTTIATDTPGEIWGYQGARMYVDSNGVRIRFGATPTATVGLALVSEMIELSRDEVDVIELIRSGGTDSEVFVSYWTA